MEQLERVSNPRMVQRNLNRYIGQPTDLYISTRKNKKYMIYDPNTNKPVHFGSLLHEDYTKHRDEKRRNNYLARATAIKGNWKDNPFSPNLLSINLLWN